MGCGGSKQSTQVATPPKDIMKDNGGKLPDAVQKVVDRDIVKVLVTIHSARGLCAADEGGTSDPYCIFKWRNQDYKTSIEYKTLEPEWGTQVALMYNPMKDEKKFTIHCLDYDKTLWDELSGEGSEPDILGSAEIDLTAAIEKPDKTEHECRANLKGKTAMGSLLVKFSGEPVLMSGAPPPPTPPKASAHAPGIDPSGVREKTSAKMDCLELTVVDAKGLRGADPLGKSDPMVYVKWRGLKYETTHCKKTINPVWNQIICLPFDAAKDKDLELYVYDYDFGNKNDFLGNCTLDISSIEVDQSYTIDAKLEGDKAIGTLTVKLAAYEKKPTWIAGQKFKFIKLK